MGLFPAFGQTNLSITANSKVEPLRLTFSYNEEDIVLVVKSNKREVHLTLVEIMDALESK